MRLILSIAAAAALLLSPVNAGAVAVNGSVHYATAYVQTLPLPSAGEYAGHMTLTFYKDGTVSGTYRDDDAGPIHIVAGGVRGVKIWLSFGGMHGRHQFNGTIGKDGIITGTLSNWRGRNVYRFTATPAAPQT